MEALLGFHVGFWDYATFIVLAILVAGAKPRRRSTGLRGSPF